MQIKTLVSRCYDGYPLGLVNRQMKMYLDNIYVPSPSTDPVQNVKEYYLSIPYFGAQSEKLQDELLVLLKHFSDIKFKIVLVNNFRVGSLFHYKDVLPAAMPSSLVYSYCCAYCASIHICRFHRSYSSLEIRRALG